MATCVIVPKDYVFMPPANKVMAHLLEIFTTKIEYQLYTTPKAAREQWLQYLIHS